MRPRDSADALWPQAQPQQTASKALGPCPSQLRGQATAGSSSSRQTADASSIFEWPTRKWESSFENGFHPAGDLDWNKSFLPCMVSKVPGPTSCLEPWYLAQTLRVWIT